LVDADLRVHGGVDPVELASLGLRREQVLDLSINVNPWGAQPNVVAAIGRAALADYPDPRATLARQAVASLVDAELERVLIGHGSSELLWAAVGLIRGQGRPLLTLRPSFSEPLRAALAWGIAVVPFELSAADGFRLDLNALDRALEVSDAGALYLCQPNNPDGGVLPALQLRALCDAHPGRLFILDQAFLSLSTRHADASFRFGSNVLCVRSLTKDHALPGLRAGYVLAAPERLAELDALRSSWLVSAQTEAAIVAASAEHAYVDEVRTRWLAAKASLVAGCTELGLISVPSATPYFLLATGGIGATVLRARLLARQRILVRSGVSFGLPDHVRIAACRPEQQERVLLALRSEATR
jgi:histidinol-phosphate/aromatic aminotransferase/cobyric acid decarboxylase-like protein